VRRVGVSRRAFLRTGLVVAGSAALTGTLGTPEARANEELPIIDCDAWGARPSSGDVNVVSQRPVKILVHHTATPNVPDLGRPAADLLARTIQQFHMDRRGWLDSGQHFTISRGGFVLEGRHRSLEVLRSGDRTVEGAHCTGQNLVAIGIENEGTYLDVDPPEGLWNQLRELCVYICRQYGISGTEIYGHRDFKDTACPGDRLYGMLPRLRGEVAHAIGQPLARREVRKATWPLLRQSDVGPPVCAAQHLLRDAGFAEVTATGRFDATTAAAVVRLQTAGRFEQVNGMIGGESWPALARTVRRGEGGEGERAVEALLVGRSAEGVPDVVTPKVWQRLLGTGA
jgi:hypothetical protein